MGIWNWVALAFGMVNKKLGYKGSGFWVKCEIQKPNHCKSRNPYFVKKFEILTKKPVFQMVWFWMVGTLWNLVFEKSRFWMILDLDCIVMFFYLLADVDWAKVLALGLAGVNPSLPWMSWRIVIRPKVCKIIFTSAGIRKPDMSGIWMVGPVFTWSGFWLGSDTWTICPIFEWMK